MVAQLRFLAKAQPPIAIRAGRRWRAQVRRTAIPVRLRQQI